MNSIILVHLGTDTPFYLKDCIHQLRLWNNPEELTIYLICERHIAAAPISGVTCIFTDTLHKTLHHQMFIEKYSGDTQFRKGYWRYVTERFFYIEELMKQYNLKDAVSMEYDVLFYGKVGDVIGKLKEEYSCITAEFDQEHKAYPAFMYFPSYKDLTTLNLFIVNLTGLHKTDMEMLGIYRKAYPDLIRGMPLIPDTSVDKIRYSNVGNKTESYSYLFDGFNSIKGIFDSLVYGQYLGGIDPRNTGGQYSIGYENESALYRAKDYTFEWKRDEKGRWYPVVGGFPLYTIHMHSKALKCFLSDRPDMPRGDYNPIEIQSMLLRN